MKKRNSTQKKQTRVYNCYCCVSSEPVSTSKQESLPVIHALFYSCLNSCVFLLDLGDPSYVWESPFTVFWQTESTFINGQWGFHLLPAGHLEYPGLIVRFSNFTDSTCMLICIVKVMSSGSATPANATDHFICKNDNSLGKCK